MLQKATLLKKLERIMMAITFAEANVHDYALKLLQEERQGQVLRKKQSNQQEKRPFLHH